MNHKLPLKTFIGIFVTLTPLTAAEAFIPFGFWAAPCALDAGWTPQYGSLIQYNTFSKVSIGAIPNGATVTSEVGVSGTAGNTGMSYVVGKTRQGVSLNGTNNYISFGNIAQMNAIPSFSMALWVNPTSLNIVETIAGKEEQFKLEMAGDGSHLKFYTSNAIGGWTCSPTSTGTLSTNTWTHIAMTYNGTIVRLYINGTADQTCAMTGSIPSTTNPYQISGWGGAANEVFGGSLDEIAVWNTALTASEISKIYARQTACKN